MPAAIDVAAYIANSIDVDHLKLQKLLFYTQAVCLVRYGKLAFDDKIEAWDYGPVVPAVYSKFRRRDGIIHIPLKNNRLESDVIHSADMVIGYYGKMSSIALVNETHSETPWKSAYKPGQNNIIEHDVMATYYKSIFKFNK